VLALTQDALVEGVDFRRAWTTPYLLGRRSLALSLSDLAAMGATPAWCLVALCAPGDTSLADVEALHEWLQAIAAEHGCPVIGGDVSAIAGPLVLDVVAGGTVEGGRALLRDAGRPGDVLVVTGRLGRAAAGLRLLLDVDAGRGAVVDQAVADAWRAAQLDPVPRVAEGRALAARGVRCAGDLSDGLLVDARRTADASACAVELWRDALPVDAGLHAVFPEEWAALALGGGEDFELLAAVEPAHLDGLLADWPADLAPLTVVGRLVEGRGLRLLDGRDGAELAPPPIASRHFGS
jgi:thiamine-monophosphate kinase